MPRKELDQIQLVLSSFKGANILDVKCRFYTE